MNQDLLHRWDVTLEEAAEIQKRLRVLVQKTNSFNSEEITTVAGVDASYKEVGRAVVVVLSFPELKILETASYTGTVNFPYVPGFLSFRETPLALRAIEKLKIRPDLLLVDGQGIAHPRRMGIATHLGLFLDMPSIGCAKSVLVGKFEEPGPNPGDSSPLLHYKEQVGVALRTKPRTKPMIISVGHKIDLPTAINLVMKCLKGYRLPEPTRLADKIAGEPETGTEQGTLF